MCTCAYCVLLADDDTMLYDISPLHAVTPVFITALVFAPDPHNYASDMCVLSTIVTCIPSCLLIAADVDHLVFSSGLGLWHRLVPSTSSTASCLS